MKNDAGAPPPLPSAIASEATTTMPVSGATAASTRKTMAATPRVLDRNWFWGEDSGTSSSFARCAGRSAPRLQRFCGHGAPVLLTLSVGGSSTRARIVRGLPGAGQDDRCRHTTERHCGWIWSFGARVGPRHRRGRRHRCCDRPRMLVGEGARVAAAGSGCRGARRAVRIRHRGRCCRSPPISRTRSRSGRPIAQTVDRFGGLDVVVVVRRRLRACRHTPAGCDPRGVVRGARR